MLARWATAGLARMEMQAMAWVKIDDHFDEHPKLAAVGPIGWGYWLAGLAYCNRNMTDGFIPWSKARSLASFEMLVAPAQAPAQAGAQAESNQQPSTVWTLSRSSGMQGEDITADWIVCLMVRAGLWDEVPGGYQIHDYAEFQPTKAQIMADREAKQAAGKAGGKASAQARAQAPAKAPAQARAKAPAQAKSKPVPVPVPHTSSSNELEETPKPPKAEKASKPKAADDSASDDAAGDEHPFVLLESMCEQMGVHVDDIPSREKSKQLGAAKRLSVDGMTRGDVAQMTRWLKSQEWRTGGIDMLTLVKEQSRWVLAGKPDDAKAPKASNPITEPQGYSRDQEEAEQQMHRQLAEMQRKALGGKSGTITHLRGRTA